MSEPSDPDVHVVVFDVNVWLDVARLLGTGFRWDRLTDVLAQNRQTPCPAQDRRIDSARSLALSMSGRMVDDQRLEVWTAGHIDDLILHKLTQPDRPSLAPEARGMGWVRDGAVDFLYDCVYELVWERTAGDTVGDLPIPAGNPPLDHEDGKVYRAAMEAGEDSAIRYCVTGDRQFREASLPGDVTVLYPSEWVHLVRRYRNAGALTKQPRPPL